MFSLIFGLISLVLSAVVFGFRLAFWLVKGALGLGLFVLAVWLIVRGLQTTRGPR